MASNTSPIVISDDEIELQGEQIERDLIGLEIEINEEQEYVQAERAISIQELQEEQSERDLTGLETEIKEEKEHVQAERTISIQERIMKNKKQVESNATHHESLATSRGEGSSKSESGSGNMLLYRMQNPIAIIRPNTDEEPNIHVTAILPKVETIPKYTTWVHTSSNLKMPEDQSVTGNRRIVHDEFGGKAIVINDDNNEDEEKHIFSDGEMRIIRKVSQKYEPNDEVIKTLQKHIGGTASEIYEAFITVKKQDEEILNSNVPVNPEAENDKAKSKLLEKSLDNCLDTFNALFCRRCLIFDCRVHGIRRPVITPAERLKNPVESSEEENGKPCENQCYKIAKAKYPERGGSSKTITSNEGPHGSFSIGTDPDSVKESSKQDVVWKPLEKDLYLKGLKIFGRNSCNITRIMNKFKTCIEVYNYMNDGGPEVSSTEFNHKESEIMSTLQSLDKKNKGKRHLTSPEQPHKQYTECACNPICEEDCPCLQNSIVCEKYCGCPKVCKNRYKGCYCLNNLCRTRQCPCFAAGRECDPDLCRNCNIRIANSEEGQCGNMKILQGEHKRILMGRSTVSGWGAFTWETVEKGDYIGEYTGELISHEEADKRGEEYDQKNSSYLFNLNDEYVIDANKYGNKLRFANHSSRPNCEPKIIKMRGDHHVGIYAKQRILAGSELFYDYRYEPENSPVWARNVKNPDKGPSGPPRARSKKKQPNQFNDPDEGPSVRPRDRSEDPQTYDPEEGPTVQVPSKKPPPHP